MTYPDSVFWDSPYGGFSLRTRSVVKSYGRAFSAMTSFTTDTAWRQWHATCEAGKVTAELVTLLESLKWPAKPDVETLISLGFDHPTFLDACGVFGPPDVSGDEKVGKRFRPIWSTKGSDVEPVKSDFVDAIVDLCARHDKTKNKSGDHILSATLWGSYLGQWTVPGSPEPLPNQSPELYEAESLGCGAQFVYSVERKSLILEGRFPFKEQNAEFVAYFDALSEALGGTLNRKRLRRAIVNANADAYYLRKH